MGESLKLKFDKPQVTSCCDLYSFSSLCKAVWNPISINKERFSTIRYTKHSSKMRTLHDFILIRTKNQVQFVSQTLSFSVNQLILFWPNSHQTWRVIICYNIWRVCAREIIWKKFNNYDSYVFWPRSSKTSSVLS